jgi:hypothetical protein
MALGERGLGVLFPAEEGGPGRLAKKDHLFPGGEFPVPRDMEEAGQGGFAQFLGRGGRRAGD